MLTTAIVLVGTFPTAAGPLDITIMRPETFAGTPIACVEVLGKSSVQRMVESLEQAGIAAFSVISAAGLANTGLTQLTRPQPNVHMDVKSLHDAEDTWPTLVRTLEKHFKNGAENVLLVRMGAYAEFDLEDLLQTSKDNNGVAVRIYDSRGPLDMWLLNAARTRSNGLVPAEIAKLRINGFCKPYFGNGYVNRLAATNDLRRLVVDIFFSRCLSKPTGVETKPGVWVDEGAQLHRQARTVAPAYIGRNAKVGAATLVTRCSNVEQGCEVDYGTVIEDSSVLRDTYIGTGLDVTHTVVRGSTLAHLQQNVLMTIEDGALIRNTLPARFRGALRRPVHFVTQWKEFI